MDIAIIGIAGRFPQAGDLEALYQVLATGQDCVRPVSDERKSSTSLPFDRDYIEIAGLDDIDQFDPRYFGISKVEASKMAPQQRLALEIVHQTLDNSGYSLEHFYNSRCSVYVGDTHIAYDKHSSLPLDPLTILGTTSAFLAGRIARAFNVRGGAAMIDTTCSSSLVALHMAVNDLKCGDSAYAIVLGVNLEEFPLEKSAYAFSEEMGANILSSSCRSKTFSAEADGTGVGEAVVGVLLKPLDAALRDRDFIHAVIKGSAINQDAALSASLTAPDPEAQAEVILAAWRKSGVNPEEIECIEAHGTGTTLGDPIEIDGIKRAFSAFTDKEQFCSVSSIKTNLGHTDSAAGLTGLAKVVLSLRHKVLFPNVHYKNPNPLIDFSKGPVYVQTQCTPWETQAARRTAGLSAFGLIGTNCHVVVQEAPARPEKSPGSAVQQVLLAVSAKTPASLRLNIEALSAFIASNAGIDLEDLAYTLLCGRNHHEYRAAAVVNRSNIDAQLAQLAAEAAPEPAPARFILVFSDHDAFPAAWLSAAQATIPGFGVHLAALRPQLPADFQANGKLVAFAYQYCFYQWLQAANIHFDALIGDGAGKQVIAVIKNTVSIPEAVETIRQGLPEAENLTQRVESLIARESQGPKLVFQEMGPMGNISAVIAQAQTSAGCTLFALEQPDAPAFETCLKQLYLAGQALHWPALFDGSEARKIPLPPYQFDRQRYWIKEPSSATAAPEMPAPVVFYETQFLSPALTLPALRQGRKLGVILDAPAPYEERVRQAFGQDQLYFIRPEEGEQAFRERITELTEQQGVEAWVEFLFSDEASAGTTPASVLAQWQRWKVYADGRLPVFVFAAKALAASGQAPVAAGACALALFKAVVADTGRRDFVFIDLDPDDAAAWKHLGNLVLSGPAFQVLALRQGDLFCETFVQTDNTAQAAPWVFKEGAYLITGGARGIGYAISRYLAAIISTGTLILLGKTPLGAAEDPDSRQAQLAELRALNEGVQVVYMQVDLADRAAVMALLAGIKETYGRLELVVHSAGVGSPGIHFAEETEATFSPVLGPKIAGTLHLYEALRGVDFQKMLLFSSLNTVLPQKGSAFYAVANAFLDAFAYTDERIQSLRWPGWNEIGMSAAEPASDLSLYPAEGLAAFGAALTQPGRLLTPVKGDMELFRHNLFFQIQVKSAGQRTTQPAAVAIPDLRQYILDLWKKALQEPDIHEDDNFFDVGGHSLLGTQIVNTLREALHVDLLFEDLYDYGTVNELAAYIETLAQAKPPVQAPQQPLAAVSAGRLPLTPAQHGVWVAHQLGEGHGNFNIPGLIELSGDLDELALEAALAGVVARHETLRTRFDMALDGSVYQTLTPVESLGFSLATEDFSALAIPDVLEHARTATRQFAAQQIRLEEELPFKAKLLRYDANTHVLALVLHHIVGDGVSIDIFIRELFENYEEQRRTSAIALKPLPVKYSDYVLDIQAYLQSAQFVEDRDWWVRQLTGSLAPLALPYDFERPLLGTRAAGKVEILFSDAESALFHRIKTELKVSGYILFTALVKLLLFKYHGPGNITVGTPYFGRFKKEYEGQIGLFVNLLVIHDQVNAAMTFSELVASVKTTYTEVLKHKMFPFECLGKEAGIQNDFNRKAFFDVSVNYWEDQQNIYGKNDYQEVNPNLKRRTFGYAESFVHEDLSFELLGGKKLYANIVFDKDLFRPITIELMKERLLQLLRNLEGGLQFPVSEYDFSLGVEKRYSGNTVNSMELEERF